MSLIPPANTHEAAAPAPAGTPPCLTPGCGRAAAFAHPAAWCEPCWTRWWVAGLTEGLGWSEAQIAALYEEELAAARARSK